MLQKTPYTEDIKPLEKPIKNSISVVAIRRHIGTLMLTLALIVVGIFFIFRLQVDLLPSITYPRVGVRVDAPGISPEVGIEEVTKPLEEALSATEGLVVISSNTREGRIGVDLFFQPSEDIEEALDNASTTLNRNRNRLPDTVEEPRIFKFDPSQLPIYDFAIQSPSLKGVDLRVFGEEELAKELNIIPGVASVDVSGGLREEVRVNVDLKRLQALGVKLEDLMTTLSDRNQDFAGGRLRGGNIEPLVRSIGKFENASEIENVVLENTNSNEDGLRNKIYLRDVAEVIDGTEEQRIFVTLNGSDSVKVSITKQPDANTLTVINSVKKRIEELKEAGFISEDMTLVPTRDESVFIRNSLINVIESGLIGTVLAALTVLVFLGSLRQTLIISLSIPLAIMTAIILMYLFNLSINVFSLGGLALGVGIVVDNSIVMLENIANNLHKDDENLSKSIEKSSQQVESALIASTTTNLVSVIPFLFLGGLISLLFNELILTVSFAVASSLLLAITVVPMLASRLLTIKVKSGLNRFFLFQFFNWCLSKITLVYTWFLNGVLRLRLFTITLAFVVLGMSSYWMIQDIPQEILPKINTGQAVFSAQFPPNTTLETNKKVMAKVEEILLNQPETEYVFTTIGGALFSNITIENYLRSTADITLKPGTDVLSYTEKVASEFEKLNLVNIRLRINPGRVRGISLRNSPVNGDLDLILSGDDDATLEKTGRRLLSILDEEVTMASFRPNSDPPETEIKIKPDWERLADLNLNATDVGETIQRAVFGEVATELQREDRLVDVRVQLPSEYRQNITQLGSIPLFLDNNNQPVLLGEVASLERGKSPGEIQRLNQKNVFIIQGFLHKDGILSEAIAEVDETLNKIELPEGIILLPNSAGETNKQLQRDLKVIGALATFLVFVVMAVQYNSLIDPLAIILTVPLALAGGIFGLYITETPMGATVLIGAVLLVGIVVNNAIVMIEFANQLKEELGISRKYAIVKAASARLRPILMTTITTVLGLFPLALGLGQGSEFLQPLGIVVFSGLSFATLLTLFIIPCFYLLLHEIFRDT